MEGRFSVPSRRGGTAYVHRVQDPLDIADLIDDVIGEDYIRASAVTSVSETLYWLHLSRFRSRDPTLGNFYLCHLFDGHLTMAFARRADDLSWWERPTAGEYFPRDWFFASPCALEFLTEAILNVDDDAWAHNASRKFRPGRELPPPDGWRELFDEGGGDL